MLLQAGEDVVAGTCDALADQMVVKPHLCGYSFWQLWISEHWITVRGD
jgi:hypothetical protein